MNSSTEVRERVVGVVDEHVAVGDHGEEVDRLVVRADEAGLGDRRPRLVLEVGPVEVLQRPQAAEVERARRTRDTSSSSRSSSRTSSSRTSGVTRGVDLEAHRGAEPAAAQLELDRGQQVVGLLLLEGEVGVAGHPERERGPR